MTRANRSSAPVRQPGCQAVLNDHLNTSTVSSSSILISSRTSSVSRPTKLPEAGIQIADLTATPLAELPVYRTWSCAALPLEPRFLSRRAEGHAGDAVAVADRSGGRQRSSSIGSRSWSGRSSVSAAVRYDGSLQGSCSERPRGRRPAPGLRRLRSSWPRPQPASRRS